MRRRFTMPRSPHVIAVAASVLCACGDSPSASLPELTEVDITGSAVSFVSIADTTRLRVAAPGDGALEGSLAWSSRDETVATVDRSGLVTAMGNGQTWIIAASSGVRDSVEVTVAQATASVEISPAGDSIWTLGGTTKFTARPLDANGHETPDGPPTWAVSDTSVAVIDDEGIATGLKDGSAIVTATVQEATGEVPLVVDEGGSVRVRFTHVGGGVDPDGYELSIGGRPAVPVSATEFTVLSDIRTGPNDLAVTGLAQHCVWRDDGQTIEVTKADTVELELEMRCSGQYAHESWADGVYVLAYADEFGVSTILSKDEIVRGHFSWSPNGEWIAFSKYVDGNIDVYLIRPDGTDERRLTTHAGADLSPTWSPDGRRIAYGNQEEPSIGIWVVDHDGTNGSLIRSLPWAGGGEGPVWSPMEDLIAFTTTRTAGSLWTMRSDGSDAQAIGPDRWTLRPVWSPDGEKLAAPIANSGTWELVVIDKNGLDARVVATSSQSALEPSWSPDGSRIAFNRHDGSGYGIYTVGADGSDQIYLTSQLWTGHDPAFTYDGSHILFGGASMRMMAVDTDGGSGMVVSPPLRGDPLPRPGS